jgi:hypothetical protein
VMELFCEYVSHVYREGSTASVAKLDGLLENSRKESWGRVPNMIVGRQAYKKSVRTLLNNRNPSVKLTTQGTVLCPARDTTEVGFMLCSGYQLVLTTSGRTLRSSPPSPVCGGVDSSLDLTSNDQTSIPSHHQNR